ncbi:MAG TPA: hypothetical protein VFV34_20335, partial [Blastocatellia bacterium]|nr:hypothetical protein [Blastocatellia bacterium]
CDVPCNPGFPELVDWDSVSSRYCVDCDLASQCTTETDYYEQYCQDGTLYASWSERYSTGCQYVWDWGCDELCYLY